jgi:hypothetical protein
MKAVDKRWQVHTIGIVVAAVTNKSQVAGFGSGAECKGAIQVRCCNTFGMRCWDSISRNSICQDLTVASCDVVWSAVVAIIAMTEPPVALALPSTFVGDAVAPGDTVLSAVLRGNAYMAFAFLPLPYVAVQMNRLVEKVMLGSSSPC